MKELVFISKSNVEIYYYKYETLEPNLLLELYRTKLFLQVQSIFIKKMLIKFGKNIFNRKKNFNRTLLNLFSSWIFVQYANANTKIDVDLFPDNNLNYDSLITTMKDFAKDEDNFDEAKIDNLVDYLDLENIMRKKKNNFLFYNKSTYYKNMNKKYEIKKKLITCEKYNKVVNYIKYDIILPFRIKEHKLRYMLNNIVIPVTTWEKLNTNFKSDKNIDEIIVCLLLRYKCLSSQNNQLAIPPEIMKKMKSDMDLSCECFASCLNNYFPLYCSIFYDLEKYFGSIGSFFDILPISGTFEFNPPYQINIIQKGVNNILKHLKIADKNNKKLTFILTLPIWDVYGKILMDISLPDILRYDDFNIIEKIKKSKYFLGLRMICKEKFSYKDYNNCCYKDKTIQNTYVIVLSSQRDMSYFTNLTQYNFYYN